MTVWCFPVLLGRSFGAPTSDDRRALGYSSWGLGQFDREMQKNVWLSAPAKIDLLFDPDVRPRAIPIRLEACPK